MQVVVRQRQFGEDHESRSALAGLGDESGHPSGVGGDIAWYGRELCGSNDHVPMMPGPPATRPGLWITPDPRAPAPALRAPAAHAGAQGSATPARLSQHPARRDATAPELPPRTRQYASTREGATGSLPLVGPCPDPLPGSPARS
ncbi:hypothetical protein GCM10010211_22610 [Streptomyces albospinus]|uniref:Uncharacterized protein n=1 Tax=Streptomyces albospinus TaxID=285515 RepID=A0ABQ2UYI9_9ACTN|nr:hypothetical protein GCM10010211_22610 [Streptomyces albospinus]